MATSTSGRVLGAPQAVASNRAPVGAVEGDQIGEQLPGVLQSLQEAPDAGKTTALYYKDTVGKFHQPSFQRSFGAHNRDAPFCRWGETSSVAIDDDIFWKGPAMIAFDMPLRYNYIGPVCTRNSQGVKNLSTGTMAEMVDPAATDVLALDADVWPAARVYYNTNYNFATYGFQNRPINVCNNIHTKCSMFYSWGAGYCCWRRIDCQLGGAGRYTLDRNANFVGVMASCTSTTQRKALMKISGGGVIQDDEGDRGSSLSTPYTTAHVGYVSNYDVDGVMSGVYNFAGSDTTLKQTSVLAPVTDRWIVALKMPHTNFNSAVHYRRPVDTSLFSSPWMFDVQMARPEEFIDTGTGYPMLLGTEWQHQQPCMVLSHRDGFGSYIHFDDSYDFIESWNARLSPACLYRQFQVPKPNEVGNTIAELPAGFNNNAYTQAGQGIAFANLLYQPNYASPEPKQFRIRWDFRSMREIRYSTTADTQTVDNWEAYVGLGAVPDDQPRSFLTPNNFPTPVLSTVVNSLRLTNDMLGAKAVLSSRADLAVYYPFQYLVTQTYYLSQVSQDGSFNQNANGYGGWTVENLRIYHFSTTDKSSMEKQMSIAITIPVNPATAMYVGIGREKDRRNLAISKAFSYSPALFWNWLPVKRMCLKYGNQIMSQYDSLGEVWAESLHDRIHNLVVPYKGGAVTRSQLHEGKSAQTNFARSHFSDSPIYPGVWHTAHIYEMCFVEQLPFINEAFMQQTPAFRGEQLTLDFVIAPSMLPYDPNDLHFSYDYAQGVQTTPTRVNYPHGVVAQYIPRNDPLWRYVLRDFPDVGQEVLMGQVPATTDDWNMNNDNLCVYVVFAQNALWQLNPMFSKIVFERFG